MQILTICECIGRIGIKVEVLEDRMEKITSTMVLYKHVDGIETKLSTMSVPLANNPMGK